jgi:hypothetical protein
MERKFLVGVPCLRFPFLPDENAVILPPSKPSSPLCKAHVQTLCELNTRSPSSTRVRTTESHLGISLNTISGDRAAVDGDCGLARQAGAEGKPLGGSATHYVDLLPNRTAIHHPRRWYMEDCIDSVLSNSSCEWTHTMRSGLHRLTRYIVQIGRKMDGTSGALYK